MFYVVKRQMMLPLLELSAYTFPSSHTVSSLRKYLIQCLALNEWMKTASCEVWCVCMWMIDRNRYNCLANLEFWTWNLEQLSVRSPGSKMFWTPNCILCTGLCICEMRIIALPIGIEIIRFWENTASSSYQEPPSAMDTVLVFSLSREGSR